MRKKRTRKISAIVVLAFALATAACTQDDQKGADSASDDPAESETSGLEPEMQADAPVPADHEVLAEARIDVDRDGTEERIVIRMTRGTKREETEPGAFMGPVREGDVRLELLDAEGRLLQSRELNPDFGGTPLLFEERRGFTLFPEDYNGDGIPELALGQYISSNGFIYNLYEVSSGGIRLLLPGLFSTAYGYSAWFEHVGHRAFKTSYYNMETGVYEEELYVWQDGRYVRSRHADLACGACRRLDGAWPGLVYVPVEDGFVLDAGEPVLSGYVHLSPPIGGTTYIIHELYSYEYAEDNAGWVRNTAAVIRPDTGDVNLYPLYETNTNDVYRTDSIAHGQGFLRDGKWVYAAAVNDGKSGVRHQLRALDPVTGNSEILVPDLPETEDTHYSVNWMTADGSRFVLVGNLTGRMWVIDLSDGKAAQLADAFPQPWPFILIYPSPDGERFWYQDPERDEFRYYDLAGNMLASFPATSGMHNLPAVSWSHDGRYTAYSDTFDRDNRHVMFDYGDAGQVAPQRLAFRNRQGGLVRTVESKEDGVYVELAGWPAAGGDVVLLERYKLIDNPELFNERIKTDRSYALLDLATGTETGLTLVDGPMPEKAADLFFGNHYGPVGLVDRDSGQLAFRDVDVRRVETGDGTWAWTETDWEARTGRLYVWDPAAKQVSAYRIPPSESDSVLAGGKWHYTTDMAARRLPEPSGTP